MTTHSIFPIRNGDLRKATLRRAALAIVLISSFALSALADPPARDRDNDGDPANPFIENLPATKHLPRSKDNSRRVPAFSNKLQAPLAGGMWTFIGPAPLPNGQTQTRTDPVSGRVSVIAVHPTNPDILYAGAAQGGVYRSLNGGASWTPLMDNAFSGVIGTPLAIGAIAFDPTNPSTILVGTGEGNLSADSFFGTGLYIITNADSFSPIVNGPYNLQASDHGDVFTGRSIVAIAVDPTNHNNIFLSTSSGVGGIVAMAYSVLPNRGLYRSTNAFAGVDGSGTPVFTRLQITGTSTTNTISTSLVMEPGNPNNLLVSFYGQAAGDPVGIYRTTDALDATPVFTQTKSLALNINVKLAIAKVAGVVTVYATTSEGSSSAQGRLYRSDDGGATFGTALTGANGFAGGQGFYDISVAVDPTNAANVYIGGATATNIFKYSSNSGATFSSSVTGLHADVHSITVAPGNASVIYHGNDGGIWKSIDKGLTWTALNNSTFSATQFQDLAVHPSDQEFSLGGTQDNGTEMIRPDASFVRADFGDGGYSLIDQNATDTTNVTLYHTYYNQTGSLLATAQVTNVANAHDNGWSVYGVGGTPNGIMSTDSVNFYAPMALGPGNPNTWYYGSDKLYRSPNRAVTATVVSQTFQSTIPVSAIAISPLDDNVRLAGLNNGKVFATTLGAPTLLQIAGAGATNGPPNTPATGVGRMAIDPNNGDTAYICWTGYGTSAAPIAHVWKTTNLSALTTNGTVNLTPMSNGLPDLPVNCIAIDSNTGSSGASTDIYVGTDAGVYYSGDGGANWSPFASGMPHVAVFGLRVQEPSHILRAATHGRGVYETLTADTPVLSQVVSRMTHGSAGPFDINMPLTGPSGVEDRRSDGTYTIIFTFTAPVTSGTVTSSVGSVSSPSFNGNTLTVTLSGVGDVNTVTLTAQNVNGTALSPSVTFGLLVGDINADRTVNGGDTIIARGAAGQEVNSSNFRDDINADGFINAGDASIARANSGNSIP